MELQLKFFRRVGNLKTKRVLLLVSVSFVILSTTIPIQMTRSLGSVDVNIGCNDFQKISKNFTITVTTDETCDIILYLDNSLIDSKFNTQSLVCNDANIPTIGYHVIKVVIFQFWNYLGQVTKTIRGRYNIAQYTEDKYRGADGYHHPDVKRVYDCQMHILQDSSLSYNLQTISSDSQEWVDRIWQVLRDKDVTPWINSNDWHTDLEIANDYWDDSICNSNPYACNDYAVFISGLARSVGLPTRIWSIVGTSETFYQTHMWAEVFVSTSEINNGWLAMSIYLNSQWDVPGSARVNWETWVDPDTKKDFQYAIGGYDHNLPSMECHWLTQIWDIDYVNYGTGEQKKAWKYSPNHALPVGYYKLPTSSSYYGITPSALYT